ncbi:MAG: CPBP family intramembrane metalloprotease [Planctomycetota bacterium]|nr:CPBP family intramembrane metalloprotease [Planctomycetota bacterium]
MDQVRSDTLGRRRPLHPAILSGLCLLPAIQTAVAVHFEFWPEVTYPLLKAAILLAPLIVWKLTGRQRGELLADVGLTRPSLWRGLAGGGLFAGVIVGGYFAALAGRIDPGPVAAKAAALGFAEPLRYWGAAAFISLGNSAIEEYYWRGFIVSQLRRWIARTGALCLVGGGLFGLHHAFALASSFPPGVVVLGVAGTVAAGGVWTWLRLRGWSLWDLYLCHVLADLAVFYAGWDLIRPRG